MKNTIILFALLFVPILGLKAQKKELENIFQQYEKTEGVTSINITKPMFGFLKALDIEDLNYFLDNLSLENIAYNVFMPKENQDA